MGIGVLPLQVDPRVLQVGAVDRLPGFGTQAGTGIRIGAEVHGAKLKVRLQGRDTDLDWVSGFPVFHGQILTEITLIKSKCLRKEVKEQKKYI